jgi:subtilisin-like proprotein convertase family protein
VILFTFVKASYSQVLYSEDFAVMSPLPTGWAQQNLSTPAGTNPLWFQGNSGVFPAQNGAATSYAACNFNSVAGNNTISNWLFMPNISIKNGDVFTFYTRTVPSPAFPDRLQVRMSLNGASTNAGTTANDVGDFTTLLLDINPTLTTTGYPNAWTQYTVTISGVPAPTSGRLAFRYFVTSGGPSGANSDYIGVDNVVYTAVAPCTGTPAPGATNSSVNPVCPGVNFTLSLATPGSGVTYQWQSSPDGTTWANITGATNATLTTNQTAATYYRCNVNCGANQGTSTPLQVNMALPSACYCTPPASDCTDDDVITRVRISTLDNASTCGTGPPAGYSNYTTTVAAPTVYSGAANPITVDAPATWTEGVCVWIDYNQNGQFETTEYTSLGNKPAGQTSVTGNIAIPSTALNGTTRMRVRIRFAGVFTNTQACTGSTFSETEDYNVTIAPCVPVTITGAPSSSTIVCGASTSFTVTTAGTLPAYSWQYRTSASGIWQTVTNGGIYSGATTATLTLTDVSQAFSGYQYRALVTGGCSAVDFTTPPATLTVNSIVPVVNPASATICAGSVQQLSLTNSVSAPVTATFTSGPVSVVIPESPGGVSSGTSTINVSGIPAGAVITEMKVRLNMSHNWVGDVCYVVKAPNGKVLNLDNFLSATGGAGTNFVNTVISSSGTALLSSGTSPYTGTFRADAATGAIIPSAPAGPVGYTPDVTTWGALQTTMNGTWTLAFFDYFVDPDPGTFTRWDIDITYVSPALAQGTWNGPAGTMFTDAAATIPYTGTPATTIYVKPTATTNNYTVSFTTPIPCTSATTTVPVNVSNPATGLTVTPATRAVCLGGSTTFTASTTGGNPIAYQWQVSTDGGLTYNNITGATSATLTVSGVTQAMSGNRYRFTVTSAPCTPAVVSTSIGTLTVNPLPTVTLSAPVVNLVPGRTTTITGTSTPAAAAGGWSWTLNGSAIGGTTNTQTVNIDGLGSYRATVTDVNGCVASSNTLVIGAEASDKLWIYPNPTTGAFQVRLYYSGSLAEKRVVTIYNPLGQAITSREFSLATGTAPYLQMDFDLGGVKAKGTYVVKVADHFTGKVISGLILVQ